MKILRFSPLDPPRGQMRGYFDVETNGLVLPDWKLMQGPAGEHWIAPPAIKEIDRDGNEVLNEKGKPRYRELVRFRDRAVREKFTVAALDALRRDHPGTLGKSRQAAHDLDADIPFDR